MNSHAPDQPGQEESRRPVDEGSHLPSEYEHNVVRHPHHTDDDTPNTESGRRFQSAAAKYQQRVKRASSVWLSGMLTGRSYAPRPNKVNEAELSYHEKEALLKERTYTIPRGYKYYKNDLPPILNPVPENGFRTALLIHIIFLGIAFVFTLAAACPIPWYRGRDVDVEGVNYNNRQFTLWSAEGGSYPTVLVREINCPLEKQFYQTISVSTIVGCIFSFFSLLLAVARVSGRGSYGWVMLLSFLAFAWTLCGNAMSISMYSLPRCDAPRFSSSARLDAGFVLSLLAWIFQLGGFLAIVLVTKLNIGPVLKHLRVMDSYYMAMLCVSLLFLCVANAGTVWKRRFNTPEVQVVRVTYWHTELVMQDGSSLYYGRRDYRCAAFSARMKASISFLILSSITLFLAISLAIPAFIARGCRIASLVFSTITIVFLFISWVVAVVVRYADSCTGAVDGTRAQSHPGVPSGIYNGQTIFPGYGVQEGLILSILAWVIVIAATVLNFRVPWPEKSE
ncbi:hypothetical protein JKF63_03532 [Porcisia hertigi]|uniref:Uncharacterized protein n=1 Tax=Porcisia hertigi TaxID=2761500 RepID=A0A836HZV3_9TRYP|nr:hypothetical protein JKF63_03532 [Porcisia hertigi]